jgi:acyl-CoA synthetase (NDP forming)
VNPFEEERVTAAAIDFEAFMRPRSIAVIGATERPDTWGNWITRKLVGEDFAGRVYPINPRTQTILGQPAYPNVASVPDAVDLAIIAIPAERVFEAIRDCAAKAVPAGLIITAGFSEARSDGREQERRIVAYARAHGLRLVGPNVSGIINLHYGLVAHPAESRYLYKTPITFICQGAYAITDIAARESSVRRGFGKFLHTGNEADVNVVDFLEYCEHDPETRGICMYIEGLRDGRRFLEVARRIAPHKPIVVFKAGLTPDGSRAAASHTGALAGSADMYRGVFRQAGIVQAPTFELSLSLTHALLEMPPLRQPTVGITTLGGSWGVMLTDALGRQGLRVPELPATVQTEMRRLGMPERASVRNPIDFGAAAGSVALETRLQIVEMLLACEAIGGVVVHGYGAPGFPPEDAPAFVRQRLEEEKAMLRSVQALQETYRKPVVLASAMTPLESQVVRDMIAEGLRFQHRLDDVAAVLAALHDYATMHGAA